MSLPCQHVTPETHQSSGLAGCAVSGLDDVHVKVMVVTLGYVMLGGAFCEWCWIVKGRAQVWLSAW